MSAELTQSSEDFLLELRCEEIPARMQAGARGDLEKLFRAQMKDAGVAIGDVTVWSTPRRLALIATQLPTQTDAVSREAKGPPEGAPDQAVDGFCRKNGVIRDQLELRDVKGRQTWFAVIEKPGRAVKDVLAEAIPAIIRAFPWPKSQRWGEASISTESLRWVRPLSGIVAILGEELVPCEVDGITSGYATNGHRFHHPGEITIGGAGDYADKLRACHVLVDHTERQDIIRSKAKEAASAAGLTMVEDEGLVIENAGLTEWPVPLLGRFDEAFLEVPPEVIQLTARVNQKYFVCEQDGKLANAFVCTANIEAEDSGEAIVAGNRKVLAARLSDARFFWDQDLKTSLADQAKKLERITFHEKLGTVADKVERVAKLARWLVEEGVVKPSPVAPAQAGAQPRPAMDSRLRGNDEEVKALADMAEQAARLCKADLVTEMVGEFPELQGLMGGYYARAEGLDPQVADAIRDHYKPVGQGDDVPTAPVTVAVSLADKLDTLVGFFSIGEKPTGSKDPFALRRAAIAIVRTMLEAQIRASLRDLLRETRSILIANTAKVFDVISFDDEDDSQKPMPVYPANISKGYAGKIIAIDKDLNPEQIIEIESEKMAYSSFSQDFIFEREIVRRTYASLVDLVGDTLLYLADRIAESQKSHGMRSDLIRSVLPREYFTMDLFSVFDDTPPRTRGEGVVKSRIRNWSSSDDPVSIVARVHALQDFVGTEDGANLLAGYKRAANILKKEEFEETELSYTPEAAEKDLIDALASAGPKATEAVEAEDFATAMAALASLRGPIDAFFDNVTVNDPDPARRSARLTLLDRFRGAVHNVADFSRIEG